MSTALGRRTASVQQTTTVVPPAVACHYLKLLQVWQWNSGTIDSVLDLAQANGFTGLLVKALDGPYWMGDIDPSHEALSNSADVSRQTSAARARGMYYFTWTNPRQFSLAQQAELTAQCAESSDGVFLDIEPYSQFWGPWAAVGLAENFMSQIRAKTDAFIALQPDPRLNALAALRISEWTPTVDAISGQHYWSDFHTEPRDELVHAASLGALYGLPSLPTLPGNALSFPADAISTFPGFAVWRYGSTPDQTLALLGSLPVTGLVSDKLEVRTHA